MGSQVIDQKWADDRGGLHDAKITQVTVRNGDLLIFVNDEWANESGLERYPGRQPGVICVRGLKAPPHVDDMVLKEMVSDVFIERGEAIKLTIICFGQHKLEAVGSDVCWQTGED